MNSVFTIIALLSLFIFDDAGFILDQQSKSSFAKTTVDAYLHIKDALAADDSREAAKAGRELEDAFKSFNTSNFSEEQKKVFDDVAEDLLENASHIGENSGNIEHQRSHFKTLSSEIYDLIKSSGAGQVLYKITDDTYNKGKGAFWLSETKEIKNPYLGRVDLKRGAVQEEIK